MLKIKLFARACQLVGQPVIEIPWKNGATASELKQALLLKHPVLQPILSALLVAVNNEYATDSTAIRCTDEVACFPPVSGG